MATPTQSQAGQIVQSYDWSYALKGARNLVSVPAAVLISAFIGYGSITREAGMSLGEAAFSVPTIWALPSNLLLVAGIASGASLLTIAIAVALASIRLLPMTMALVPQIKAPHSKRWHLMLASCLVAVTAWVHALQAVRDIPVRGRLPYFVGFACSLVAGATAMTVFTYLVAGQMPPLALAGLYFLTPVYFSVMIWQTARDGGEKLALLLGLVLAPAIAIWLPQSNILLAGFGGGVVAYLFQRVRKRAAGVRNLR